MSPIRQGGYFYDANWTYRTEDVFISELVKLKENGQWNPENLTNDAAIAIATVRVNELLNLNNTTEFYTSKVVFLRERYETHEWLRWQRGDVRYDQINNVFHPRIQNAWEKLVSMRPLAAAYKEQGDPHWNRLITLFYFDPTPDYEEPDLGCRCVDPTPDYEEPDLGCRCGICEDCYSSDTGSW